MVIVLVTMPHATCALLINEFQGGLVDDLKNLVQRLVPERPSAAADPPSSRSGDGDARARLRRARLNQSVAVAASHGELVLGRFQSIILTEPAGPWRREVMVHVIGE